MTPINLEHLTYQILGDEYPLPLTTSKADTKDGILMYSTILFAIYGYEGVSVNDIANTVKIKPASLYNHFKNKEAIWEAAVCHSEELFLLYFETLEAKLTACNSMSEALEISYREPKLMRNAFTCFAFTMLINESLYNPLAWQIVHDKFYVYAIDVLKRQYERFVDNADDAYSMATILTFSVYTCLGVECQRLLGRTLGFAPSEVITHLEKFLQRFIENNQQKVNNNETVN
ncbi:MAG: TetR/AcrR family transcriptional regulator [Oscillospiraceae bacterium]|jgi:AcrR family transcriptional regulator|nr:TetR/AcrR family transcriptional regulator [Oscillospiraceae bacterium]